jgi:hypothetical protein
MMDKRRIENNQSTSLGEGVKSATRGLFMISHLVRASTLAFVCVAALATESPARTPYDGTWSVLIVTTVGDCDRAYRYGITIANGNIVYDGGVVNLYGRVSGSGAVRVTVASGNARANGTGRLNRRAGSGGWHGNSGQNRCSGYWQANRT